MTKTEPMPNDAKSPRPFNLVRELLGAVICGLIGSAVALTGLAIFLWWQYGFDSDRYYEFCGFPAIGIFAVMSATYVTSRATQWSFGKCIALVAVWTVLIWFWMHAVGAAPKMYRSSEVVHWQRIEFVLFLLLPAWSMAVLALIFHYARGKRTLRSNDEKK